MTEYEYYEVLGCSKESSYRDLKNAYRKLILLHHPDKRDNQDNKDTCNMFQQIETAWKVLRDPVSKQKYDEECKQAELESQSTLVYARITTDEMEISKDNDILTYRCRCGSDYLVNRDDLVEKNCIVHIPCQECTFVIAVET